MPAQISNVIGDSLKRKSEVRRLSNMSGINLNLDSAESLEHASKKLNSTISIKQQSGVFELGPEKRKGLFAMTFYDNLKFHKDKMQMLKQAQ